MNKLYMFVFVCYDTADSEFVILTDELNGVIIRSRSRRVGERVRATVQLQFTCVCERDREVRSGTTCSTRIADSDLHNNAPLSHDISLHCSGDSSLMQLRGQGAQVVIGEAKVQTMD